MSNPTLEIPRDQLQLMTVDEVVEFLSHLVALVGVDPMRTFTKTPVPGRLSTELGHEVMQPLNEIAAYRNFVLKILLKDWHPKWHISYQEILPHILNDPQYAAIPYALTLDEVKSWQGGPLPLDPLALKAGHTIDSLLEYFERVGFQMLWPKGEHALQGSTDAVFHDWLNQTLWQGGYVVTKGTEIKWDSYGGFADNGGFKITILDSLLKRKQVTHLVTGGLCTEYCDKWTVEQARERNYEVLVLVDAVRPVFVADEPKGFGAMHAVGAKFATNATFKAAAAKLGWKAA